MYLWQEEQEKALKKATEKFDTLGPLGVTAEDYKAIGGTPPEELSQNPGKTLLDLWTNEQVLDYLRGEEGIIEKYSADEYKKDPDIQGFLRDRKRILKLSIEFLRREGRLPSVER